MFCPFCRHPDSRVIDSRTSDDGLAIRRRRQCPECGGRFTTTETASLSVVKRSGIIEPFSRDKIVVGVRKACQGRPVTDAQLALLAQTVEETIRATGVSQVDANDIGLATLPPLRELDEVAYLRFARTNPGAFKLMFGAADLDVADPDFRTVRRAAYEELGRIVRPFLSDPEDAAADRRLRLLVWSSVHGYAHLLASGQIDADPHDPASDRPPFDLVPMIRAGVDPTAE